MTVMALVLISIAVGYNVDIAAGHRCKQSDSSLFIIIVYVLAYLLGERE